MKHAFSLTTLFLLLADIYHLCIKSKVNMTLSQVARHANKNDNDEKNATVITIHITL